jgi:DHA2 family methylenomycin A resistance protein-like MFS transporter
VVGAAALSAAAAVALVAVERRAADPFVPPALLRQRPVRSVLAARFLADFAYVGILLASSLLLRELLGYPASAAAAVLLVPTVLFSVAGPLFGHLEGRWSRRGPAMAGIASVAAGAAAMAAGTPGGSVGLLAAGLAVAGLGLGAAGPFLAAAVAEVADPAELGAAVAAVQTASQVGGAVGVGVAGTLVVGAATAGPFVTAFLVAAVAATAATVATTALA